MLIPSARLSCRSLDLEAADLFNLLRFGSSGEDGVVLLAVPAFVRRVPLGPHGGRIEGLAAMLRDAFADAAHDGAC